MFLLDTNIVSELRRPKPHGAVVAWINRLDDRDLYLSAVTIGEIQAGIEITRQQDRSKADELERWLDSVTRTYNILAMDAGTFRLWAKWMHKTSDTLYEDAMIAATAKIHGLIVATRNVADFRGFAVPLLNPFDGTSR